MLFGEIVEPSTRALILDEELEDLPEYTQPQYEWEGNSHVPDDLENLIFTDSHKVNQICSKLCKNTKPVAKLVHEGLLIYKFPQNYLVLFDGNSQKLNIGEIVELLATWIKKAKTIHCITSTLISTFQPSESSLITFTRCLTNLDEVPYQFCKRLESPNLIQGLGASIFTYCIHNNVKASLWVIYTDNMPIDSVNSAEIVKLFKTLGLDIQVDFRVDTASSNLYM